MNIPYRCLSVCVNCLYNIIAGLNCSVCVSACCISCVYKADRKSEYLTFEVSLLRVFGGLIFHSVVIYDTVWLALDYFQSERNRKYHVQFCCVRSQVETDCVDVVITSSLFTPRSVDFWADTVSLLSPLFGRLFVDQLALLFVGLVVVVVAVIVLLFSIQSVSFRSTHS